MKQDNAQRMKLTGQNILLGITGGIAAYKCAELVRLFKKSGASVQVVMSESAQKFITPLTLQTLSQRPVRTDLFDLEQESTMGHIDLARWADIVLVVPATANFIAQLANGEARNLLSTLCLATEAPLVVVPAMNRVMWHNKATMENVQKLARLDVRVWGPAEGEQACGEIGEGRMLEPQQIQRRLINYLTSGPMQGVRVLITAGPTHEAIDPVRYIANKSSGKMGFALAQALVKVGAEVVLVSGPVALETPAGVERIDVVTANEMFDAVLQRVERCDIFVACAAVADYRVALPQTQKMKKNHQSLTLELLPNIDILAYVAKMPDAPFTLGFAAETQQLVEYASKKRVDKGIDVVAANWVAGDRGGFGSDENALTVIWEQGQIELPMANKKQLAHRLVSILIDIYQKHKTDFSLKTLDTRTEKLKS